MTTEQTTDKELKMRTKTSKYLVRKSEDGWAVIRFAAARGYHGSCTRFCGVTEIEARLTNRAEARLVAGRLNDN